MFSENSASVLFEVKCLILSADSLTRRVFLTVSAFKELVIVAFMQFICEHILFTLAEDCGENVILVMKYDNKEKQSHYMFNHRHAIKAYLKFQYGNE